MEAVKHDAIEQTIKAVPAVAGATIASFTLNEWVAIATLVYIIIQTAFLLWRWYREIKKDREE